MTTTTPDMALVLPEVSITAGPQWATLLNAAFTRIDAHDHSPGNGVLITPSGLNITADLSFVNNNATNLRTVRLTPNNTFSPVAADRNCLYALGGELYYIDASGNNVQITLNGTIDVSNAITALSIKDSGFFVQYFGDTTRQFRFNASAIPTGTTRILSVPDSGGNDTFVTQGAAQTLTNKTLTSSTIATPSITTAANITAVTAPAAPAAGTANIYVSSVDGQLHLQNSAGVDTAIGAGSSTGKNYLQSYYGFTLNPLTGAATSLTTAGNRTTSQGVFGTSTASAATLITYNTASPLRAPGDLQITFPVTSVGAFVETPLFTLDSIDANTASQFISFDASFLTGGAVAGDVTVQVTQYDATGNYVGTITPSIVDISTQYSTYKAAFTPSATVTAKYAVRFTVNTANASTVDIQNIVVGPQFTTNTAAVGAWVAYTPTFVGFGTVAGLSAYYRRVGDTMEVMAAFATGTTTAVTASMSLPAGLTVDGNKLPFSNSTVASAGQQVGSLLQNGSTNKYQPVTTNPGTSPSVVYFGTGIATSSFLTPALGTSISSSSNSSLQFTVPIAQWNATTTLAGNANIEYAYNSSGITAAGASDTTAFAYGAQGALIGSVASTTTTTSNTSMRVRFQTSIQPTDRIIVEVSANGSTWTPAADRGLVPTRQSTASFGVGTNIVNATDVDVFFGNAGSLAGGATYGAAGTAWSAFFNTYRWRVAKYSAVGLAELAPATATSLGSVQAGRVPGQVSGVAIGSGFVGERVTSSAANQTVAAGATTTPCNVTVSPGVWQIKAFGAVTGNASLTYFLLGVSTDSTAGSFSDLAGPANPTAANASQVAGGTGINPRTSVTITVNISATTTYYCKTSVVGTAITSGIGTFIEAVRIA